jgi:GT2 family glycosyltransferase
LSEETLTDVSVIVPAFRSECTLPGCVANLLAQRFAGRFEVIVVASADDPRDLPRLDPDPRLKVVAVTPRHSAARARNMGAALARGRLLAFTDSDVTAPPGWLTRMCERAAGVRCVAGSVINGTPDSRAGTVEYLVEFSDLHPHRRLQAQHGATCNLLLPREVWERFGPFPEDLGACEDTLLTWRLREAGLFVFAREAPIVHHNRRRLPTVLAHQYALAAGHARLERRLGHVPARPGRTAIRRTLRRVGYLYGNLADWAPREHERARQLFPLVLLGFGAWGLGLWSESRRDAP